MNFDSNSLLASGNFSENENPLFPQVVLFGGVESRFYGERQVIPFSRGFLGFGNIDISILTTNFIGNFLHTVSWQVQVFLEKKRLLLTQVVIFQGG